jgi:DNA invertase Pin-like site-specific DNA recombinase
LGDQDAAIRRHVKDKHGTNVTRMFTEAESSVREKFEAREQIQALMREVRKGDLVIVDKVDRWSRDPEFSYRSVREILAAGASFYAVGDACDPSTPEGDTMLNFRILFAREEHKRIKQRMVGTRKLLRDRGYYVEGLPPYGYRRAHPKGYKGAEKNILVVHESEAKRVRRAFELCIQGQSLREIAGELGLKMGRVNDMVRNRAYLGEMRNTAGEWIHGKHPAILDAGTFARAQTAVVGRRHGPRPGEATTGTSDWILRDVVRCAICGGRASAAYGGGKGADRKEYYRCFRRCSSRYVPVRAAEAEAEPLIVARLEELREELAREPKPERKAPAPNMEERRAKLRRRRERYLEAFADENMTREELRAAMAKLDGERLRLDGEEQSAKKASPLAGTAARRSMLRKVGVIRKAWGNATPEERRAIVAHLVHEARLAAGEPCTFVWRSAEELAEDAS